MLLSPTRSCLLIIDVQERLAPAVSDPEGVIRRTGILMQAAARLGIPVLISEQYPKGLGATVPALSALAPEGAVVEKLNFACTGEPEYRRRLEKLGRDQAVIVGMEAHVCVLQTALGLEEEGYRAAVVADAVSSRREEEKAMALDRLRAERVMVVTTEMVVFEWMERAGTPAFKELSALIK